MDIGHEIEHFKRGWQLWRLNMRLSQGLKCTNTEQKIANLILKNGARRYLKQIEELHLQLFKVPLFRFLHYSYLCKAAELSVVLVDEDDKVVGYSLYMFHLGEYEQGIMHEQYIGLDPHYQGQGLATQLRKFAATKYASSPLNALACLVFDGDVKNLRSAQKAGFAIIKRSLKPSAHYLLLRLK